MNLKVHNADKRGSSPVNREEPFYLKVLYRSHYANNFAASIL